MEDYAQEALALRTSHSCGSQLDSTTHLFLVTLGPRNEIEVAASNTGSKEEFGV